MKRSGVDHGAIGETAPFWIGDITDSIAWVSNPAPPGPKYCGF